MRRNSLLILAGLLLTVGGAWGGAEVPQGVSPGGSRAISLIDARCPTFSWSQVAGAQGYELVVYEVDEAVLEATDALEAEASPPVLRMKVPGTAVSWTPSLERCLAPGGQYAWFVRAIGDLDAGEWSTAKVFEVASVPSIAEVEETLEVLRRYTGEAQSAPRGGEAPADLERVRERARRHQGDSGLERPSRQASGSEALGMGREQRARRQRLPSGDRAGLQPGLDAEGMSAPGLMPVPAEAAAPTLGTASLTVDGQIHLEKASSVFKDGTLFLWSDTDANTALGAEALSSNTIGTHSTAIGFGALEANTGSTFYGSYNTAVGSEALSANTVGDRNVAVGSHALRDNTTGYYNTASGYAALLVNTTGFRNTANGRGALLYNISGSWNTATGAKALYYNATGSNNTAIGEKALYYNSTGYSNTASGRWALYSNTTGVKNTATGANALVSNLTGHSNTASGYRALFSTTTGLTNTATGARALRQNTIGSRNVALGYAAGFNATTGDDNIFISHVGVAADAGKIRIGTQGTQSDTFIAGIFGSTVTGSTVVVDSNGQLGVAASTRRFKEEIEDMEETSSGLLALRPVTFRYKEEVVEGPRPVEFGLIAEEVAELYPDLVAYDEAGQPYTVRYHVLIPMLLNELQKQHHWSRDQEKLRGAQERRLGEQQETLRAQENRLVEQRRDFERLLAHQGRELEELRSGLEELRASQAPPGLAARRRSPPKEPPATR